MYLAMYFMFNLLMMGNIIQGIKQDSEVIKSVSYRNLADSSVRNEFVLCDRNNTRSDSNQRYRTVMSLRPCLEGSEAKIACGGPG